MRPVKTVSFFLLLALAPIQLHAQDWFDRWMQRVSATQAEQPHWVTPVATVTPRLEQEIRFDVFRQETATGSLTNIDGGKGLELIPTARTEIIFNVPPYLVHENPNQPDGFGDVSFLLKYRILSRNHEHGDYILTAFLAASIPTGTYKNGADAAIITPTLAFGKGWRKFDVQATLGGGLPVSETEKIGRTVISNSAFQYHAARFLWPEFEVNSTFWFGGLRDGKKQTFLTPGLVIGRFPLHNRIGLTMGAGFQIAATTFHQYNHAVIGTIRMPF